MAGSKFVAGDTLTYVDFMFWEILDHMTLFGMFYKPSQNLKPITYDKTKKTRLFLRDWKT